MGQSQKIHNGANAYFQVTYPLSLSLSLLKLPNHTKNTAKVEILLYRTGSEIHNANFLEMKVRYRSCVCELSDRN